MILTLLQKRFIRAKATRRAIREWLKDETGSKDGYGLFADTFRGFAAGMTDTQIRDILYYSLQAVDLTQAERKEIERILDLA